MLTKLPYISVCNTNLPQARAEVAAWLLSECYQGDQVLVSAKWRTAYKLKGHKEDLLEEL